MPEDFFPILPASCIPTDTWLIMLIYMGPSESVHFEYTMISIDIVRNITRKTLMWQGETSFYQDIKTTITADNARVNVLSLSQCICGSHVQFQSVLVPIIVMIPY